MMIVFIAYSLLHGCLLKFCHVLTVDAMADRGRRNKQGCNTTYKVVGTQQHPSGYTQYKIIITIVKLAPQAQDFLQEKVLLKRYNEVRNLYKTLFNLHKSLYLPDNFPAFVKPHIFGRFDDAVLKERVKCIQDLFDFICEYKALHNSKEMQEFIKTGQPLDSCKQMDMQQVMRPMEATKPVITEPVETSAVDDAGSNLMMEFDPIKHKQDVPVSTVRDDWLAVLNNAVLNTQEEDNSTHTTPPPSISVTGEDNSTQQQVEDCAVAEHSHPNAVSFTTQSPDNSGELSCAVVVEKRNEGIKMLREQHRRLSKARAYLQHVQQRQRMPSDQPSDQQVTTNQITTSKCNEDTHRQTATKSSEMNGSGGKELRKSLIDLKKFFVEDEDDIFEDDQGAYLVTAAYYISAAQEASCGGNYQNAINEYHTAVDILIKGVQVDTDESRVQAVRRKTAKYLQKAEDIHRKYLKNILNGSNLLQDGETARDLDSPSPDKYDSGRTSGDYPSPRHCSSHMSNYKVIGVVGKIMIAIETSTQQTFAIKIFPKLLHRVRHRKAIIPTNVPYMIKLHKYFSTESSIILVLDYVSGGNLWDRKQNFAVRNYKLEQEEKEARRKNISHVIPQQQQVAESEEVNNPQAVEPQQTKQVESLPQQPEKSPLKTHIRRNSSLLSWDGGVDDCLQPSNNETVKFDDEATNQQFTSVTAGDNAQLFTIDSVSTIDEDQSSPVKIQDYISDSSSISPCPSSNQSSDDDEQQQATTVLLSEQDLSSTFTNKSKLTSANPTTKRLHEGGSVESSADEDDTRRGSTVDVVVGFERSIDEQGISTVDPVQVFRHVRSRSQASAPPSVSEPIMSDMEGHDDDVGDDNVIDDGGDPLHKTQLMLQHMTEKRCYRLPEHVIRSWAAEMIISIGTLHSIGIFCRDFNPNNILLTDDGHVRLTYFGKWRYVDASVKSNWMLDMSEISPSYYTAPEMNKIYDKTTEACDWWSLGAVLYELFCTEPLHRCYPCGMSAHTIMIFPSYLSEEAKSLLKGLLQYHPGQRLGFGSNGLDDLMSHPFFTDIDWNTRIEFSDV